MTTIQATINSLPFESAATRLDIWHEGGGIGHWELELDNITGASQILSANLVASALGINGTVFMAGYVDDVLPNVKDPSAVFSKYVKVTGRNYGRDLANLFLIYKFTAIKFDDLVHNVLLWTDSEITYTSPHTAPVVDADFNKTYLQNGLVDAAKLVDYDFTVKNDKAFQLWALADAPSSGVLLKSVVGATDNNILLIDPETKAGVDIRNYIRVDAGTLNDHWTEGNADDFTVVNCTATNDTSVFVAGASSIKTTILSDAQTYLYLQFFKYSYQYLDFSVNDTTGSIFSAIDDININLRLYLKDDENNEIEIIMASGGFVTAGWRPQFDFSLGPNTQIDNNYSIFVGGWFYLTKTTVFTWKITRIGVAVESPGSGSVNKHFWIDGLKIGGVDVFAIAQDIPGSQVTYGRRMIPLTRTDVKSQLQLQDIADIELIVRKDPVYKLALTCTLQTALLYAGYLVDVLAPDAYIGSGSTPVVYRILSIHHTAAPGEDLCKGHDAITVLELVRHDGGVGADPTRFKLASSPQAAINTRYDSRLRVLEGSFTGSGSIVGGGGGTVDWMNVPYIKVLGNVFFESLTQLECVAPTAYTWAQLEPYLWGFDGEGNWTPDALTLPLGDAKLRFKDITTGYYIELGYITTEMDPSPILFLSQHLLVKKDISCGGMIGSNQGALNLGSGLQAVGDMPQIILGHSEVGYGYKNILEINLASGGLANLKVSRVYVDTLSKVNGDSWNFAELDAYGYLTNVGGVRLFHGGVEKSDIYENKVGNDYIVEISGTGVIIDGSLNVASLASTGQIGIALADGTAPLSIVSTTLVSNLNADRVDGHHSSDFVSLDAYGYLTNCYGIRLFYGGTERSDIYENRIGTSPNYTYVIEISGTGVIIDGSLNVASVSVTGTLAASLLGASLGVAIYDRTTPANVWEWYSEGNLLRAWYGVDKLTLDASGNLTNIGYHMIGSTTKLYNSAAGVLQLQDQNGALATLDVSNLYVDHIMPASGGSLYIQIANGYSMLWQYPLGTTVASLNSSGQLSLTGQLTVTGARTYLNADSEPYALGLRHSSADVVVYLGADATGNLIFSQVSGVQIGKLSTAGTLTIAGNLYICGRYLYDDGTYLRSASAFVCDSSLTVATLVNTTTTGPLYVNANHTLGYNGSSKRYKENIEDLINTEWIYNLRPVAFDWKAEDRKAEGRQMGLIAEEVIEINPQLVWNDKEGLPEGVHTEFLITPMLIEMKKLRAEVDNLRSQIKILKGGVSA